MSVNHSKDAQMQDLVRYAALKRHAEGLRVLLSQQVDANFIGASGFPILIETIKIGNVECVDVLLEYGANPNFRGKGGITALMVAASVGSEQLFARLVTAGASLAEQDLRGMTCLMRAASRGDERIVRRILSLGCDPEVRDAEGRNAADHARLKRHDTLARWLDAMTDSGANSGAHDAEQDPASSILTASS